MLFLYMLYILFEFCGSNEEGLKAPKIVNITATSNSINIFWNATYKRNPNDTDLKYILEANCILEKTEIIGCDLIYNKTVYNKTAHKILPFGESIFPVEVKTVSPASYYVCKGKLIHKKESPWSDHIGVYTNEYVPSPPTNLTKTVSQLGEIVLSWKKPKCIPGILRCYNLLILWKPFYPIPDHCKSLEGKTEIHGIQSEYQFFNSSIIKKYYSYNMFLTATTSVGESDPTIFNFISDIGIPSSVTNLSYVIRPRNKDPFELETKFTWMLPCNLRGELKYFKINLRGGRPNYDNQTFEFKLFPPSNINNNELFYVTFEKLKPQYNYTITITAIIQTEPIIITGLHAKRLFTYPGGVPSPKLDYMKNIFVNSFETHTTTTTASLLLPLFSDENGDILFYAIMVSKSGYNAAVSKRFQITNNTWPDVATWEESMIADFTIPYQATKLWWTASNNMVDINGSKAVQFVLGEDSECESLSINNIAKVYCNGPLQPNTLYEVRMRAFTNGAYADSISFNIKTKAGVSVGVIVGTAFGILIIVIYASLLVVIRISPFQMLLLRLLKVDNAEAPVEDQITDNKRRASRVWVLQM